MGVMDYGGIDKKEAELLQFELLKMDTRKEWPPSLMGAIEDRMIL
jgi:hypothetical protein